MADKEKSLGELARLERVIGQNAPLSDSDKESLCKYIGEHGGGLKHLYLCNRGNEPCPFGIDIKDPVNSDSPQYCNVRLALYHKYKTLEENDI